MLIKTRQLIDLHTNIILRKRSFFFFPSKEKVLNKKIDVEVVERRDGDAEALYANSKKAKTILKWRPARTIEESIQSAYKWEEKLNNIIKKG